MIKNMITQILKNKITQIKGQALAELAIFSAIFLYVLSVFIQYGLSASFEQDQEMLTFRRALSSAAGVSQTSRVATAVRLNDRSFPDARDAFGINERNSVSAQGTVTWSNALYAKYGYHSGMDLDKDQDLPRVIYVVNDNERTYTTAAFRVIPENTWCMYKQDSGSGCSESTIRLKSYDENGHWYYEKPIVMYGWTESHGIFGSDWKPREDPNENTASDGYTYQRVLDLEGKYADVDGDDKDELIIKQFETVENRWDSDTKKRVYVSGIAYLDFQEGEIDTTINDKDIQAGRQVQGISPNYSKTLVVNTDTALTRQENMADAPDSIVTTTTSAAEENIIHYIYTNDGGETQTDSFATNDSVTWETPND